MWVVGVCSCAQDPCIWSGGLRSLSNFIPRGLDYIYFPPNICFVGDMPLALFSGELATHPCGRVHSAGVISLNKTGQREALSCYSKGTD